MEISTIKLQGGEYDVFIGAVKIAEIHFIHTSSHWTVEMRSSFSKPVVYETMNKAIADLLNRLHSPSPHEASLVK